MAGAGDVQVGGALHQERRWGAGANERALKMNSCGRGGGRKEGTIQKIIEEKGGTEG